MPTDITNKELLVAMTHQLGVITDNMATKDDLKAFATKRDVEEIVDRKTKGLHDEQFKQGVLLESLSDDVKKIAESVSNELKLKRRVDGHDKRIVTLENNNKAITLTVKHHSRQIKTLQTAKS